jgi:hypothetical protein
MYTTQTYPNTILTLKEKVEDTKGVIISRKLKDKQYNGRRKGDKVTNNNPQNSTQKTEY